MNAIRLAPWRDAALILLAVQAMVLALPLAAGLYWGLRGVRRLREWLRPKLFETRLHVWRIQHGAERVIQAVAATFVWVQSAAAGLRRALQMLGWR
jgi:hypothetical protein